MAVVESKAIELNWTFLCLWKNILMNFEHYMADVLQWTADIMNYELETF